MPNAAVAKAKIKKAVYDSPEELDLVHRAKRGDESAFTALYNHHYSRLIIAINRIVQDEGESEWLANVALTKAWQNLKKFDEQSKFNTWITRIAINEGLMHQRSKKRKHREVSLDAVLAADIEYVGKATTSVDPVGPSQRYLATRDLELEGIADRQVIALAFESIPAPYQEALRMRYIDGDSVDEVRKNLRFRRNKTSTVKSRLMRGRNLLVKKVVKLSSVR